MAWLAPIKPPNKYDAGWLRTYMEQIRNSINYIDEGNIQSKVQSPNIYITTDNVTKGTTLIDTALITKLVVGENVEMSPMATISWNQLTDVPPLSNYSDEDAVAAWAASGYATYIDMNGIYTGTLTALQINAINGISLGANATIDWDFMNKPTAEQVGAVTAEQAMANWVASGYATHINSEGVYTGTLTALQINAVTGISLGANATIDWAAMNKPTAEQVGAIPATYIDGNNVFTINVYGDRIRGNYISTKNFTINPGENNDYVLLTHQYMLFEEYVNGTNDTAKMALGFIKNKDGVNIPGIVFGAGDGYGNNRGYIQKDTSGLSIYYIDSVGGVSYLQLTSGKAVLNGYDIFLKNSGDKLAKTYIADASTWDGKLSEVQTKAILEDPAKSWQIPSQNLKNGSKWDNRTTQISDTGIYSGTIIGNLVATGGSGADRLELYSNTLTSYNTSNYKHGFSLEKDVTRQIYSWLMYYLNVEQGGISYAYNPGGYGQNYSNMLIYTNQDTNLKLYSTRDMSIEVYNGHTMWIGSQAGQTATINIGGVINLSGTVNFTGGTTVTGISTTAKFA